MSVLVPTDRTLAWALVILAAAVLGWTLAVDLEMDWMAMSGLAAGLVLVALIWLWKGRQKSDEPPL